MPRFDQSFNGLCEQNLQDTLQLKQRYLDAKAKRVPKSKDKKQQEAIQSSVHVQQKFLKRPADDHDPSGSTNVDTFEPPVKLQCTTQHGNTQNEGLTKFHVEIVQQLEFTTSAANSQPQQISANVTVKAHTNASVNSSTGGDVQSPKSNPSTPSTTSATSTTTNLQQQQNVLDVGTLVECVKQEPDNDFADLDQCAAALEKDAAANGGTTFENFCDLIGDDTSGEIMTSAAFKDLITDITTNYSDYLDFESKPDTNDNNTHELKVEEPPPPPPPQPQQPQQPPPPPDNKNILPNYSAPVVNRYNNMDFTKTELSPAAQTLKQMAEQHHKNQLGLTSFNTNNRVPNSRSPYHDFQFQNDYANQQQQNYKQTSFQQQNDMIIKQEMMMNDFDMKRKVAPMYKQPYSPYSNGPNTGSPNYMPRTNSATSGTFRTNTPPRPPSGPPGGGGAGGQTNSNTIQINQAQQLNINPQNHGIQVSAGQHLHLSSDSKGNVSIATQQGMHFSQSSGMQPQQQQQQQQQNSNQQPPNVSNHLPINQNPVVSSQTNHLTNNRGDVKYSYASNMVSNTQQSPNMAMGLPQQQQPQPHPSDGYSMSQTQTINFTQQSLRRAAGPNQIPPQGAATAPPPPQPAPPSGPPRMINVQTSLEQQQQQQQKFLQQQMLRVHQQQQQQAVLQQQMAQRPPPPDYKTSAGMMQGLRYGNTAAATNTGNMRRMPHQPMPPSGPMIRNNNNMYMMQQQQQQHNSNNSNMGPRNMYPRQQNTILPPGGGMDGIGSQHAGNNEWRHLMIQQQQQNFGPMRNNFQQNNFNMQTSNIQMLQHQQIRQQSMGGGGGGGGSGMMNAPTGGAQQQQPTNNGPMMQMNNMNQSLMTHMQQQQSIMQQQQNNGQIPMSNIHMHQSQSITVTNQIQQHGNMSQMNQNSQQIQQQQTSQQQQQQQNNSLSNFNPTTDFNFEFFDSLPTTDTTSLTDQELLNSFDSDAGFNLVDF